MRHRIAPLATLMRRHRVCRCGELYPCVRRRTALDRPVASGRGGMSADVAGRDGQLPDKAVLRLGPGDYWEPYGRSLLLTAVRICWDADGRWDHGVFVKVTGVPVGGGARRTVYVREQRLEHVGVLRPASVG